MLINNNYISKVKEVSDNFIEAEKKIKNAELLNKNLSIPSINELRYACYHLLKASQKTENSNIEIELDKANRHVKRAYYDGVESVLLLKLEEIEQFDREYNKIPELLEVIPTYTTKFAEVTTVVECLQNIDVDNRDEKYKIIEEHYDKINKIASEFNLSKPIIISKIDNNEQKEKREHRKFIIIVLLTILAIVVAIVIGALTI